MARFTLLEVHLDDAQFTANAPFSGESDQTEAESSEPTGVETDESGGRSLVPVLVGIVTLAGLAAVVRRLLSGRDEGPEDAEAEEPIIAD